jgi:predicted kinase
MKLRPRWRTNSLRLGHSVIVDAVNPIEAPRQGWRNLAAKYRADLKIIECVCVNETTHRQRIEARIRNIERRAEYEPWTDERLTLDTSDDPPEQLLADALNYVR